MSLAGPFTTSPLVSPFAKPATPHVEPHPAPAPEVHQPADLRLPSDGQNLHSLLGGTSAVPSHVQQYAKTALSQRPTAGEQHAHAAIDTSSVADKRDAAEKTMKDGNARTASRAAQLYDEVIDGKTPHGTQGHYDPKTGEAVITKKDAQGNVVSSERISYGSDGSANIETTGFEKVNGKSVETTSRQTAGLDGSYTTTEATQPGAPSKAIPGKLDDKALMADRSGDVSYTSTKLGNAGSWIGQDGGKLTSTTISASGGKSSESETQYWHEDDVKVDDKLKGAFHDGGADKSETRTFSFGDGGPTMTKSIATSQGSGANAVQATSTVSKQLSDPDTQACLASHSAADALALKNQNQDQLGFDGDTHSPKQWLLEKSTGNEYKSQTFVEGHTDASVITDKKVSGDTVTQTQSGKWFNKDGKVESVSGNAATTYGDDGRIDAYDSHQTDADGNKTDEMFSRTRRKNGESTDLKSWSTPANGVGSFYEQKENTKDTAGGPELLSASQLIDNGTHTAYASQDGKQTSLTYDGQAVGKGSTLDSAAKTLLGQAGGKLQGQLANFALGNGALEAKGGDGENPGLDFTAQGLDQIRGQAGAKTDALTEERIKRYMQSSESIDSVTRDLTAINAGGGILQGAIGTASAIPASVSAGTALANAIQSGDGWKIGQAGAGAAGAGIGVAQAGLNTVGGLALGISGGEKGLGALELATKLDKFGVAAGVLGGGVEAVSGIVNGNGKDIAKGGVTAAGAVGGMLAADAAAGALAGSEVPLLGNAVGALVGLGVGGLTYGVTKLIDSLGDDEHQIADRKI